MSEVDTFKKELIDQIVKKAEWASTQRGPGDGPMGTGGGDFVSSCPICAGIYPNDKNAVQFIKAAWGHRRTCPYFLLNFLKGEKRD